MHIVYIYELTGEMIISSAHHEVQAISKSAFQIRMILTIRNLQEQDFGRYFCSSKNSLGEAASSIRIYGKFAKNSLGDVDFSIRLYSES